MTALRAVLGVVFALLFAVVAPAALAANWVSTVLDDTDAYVDTVGDLSADPEVRDEVAGVLTQAALSAIAEQSGQDVADQNQALVAAAVDDAVDSGTVDDAWQAANRSAHEQVVAVLRGEQSSDEQIQVSLTDVYAEIESDLEAQGVEVPEVDPNLLSVSVPAPAELADAQDLYQKVVSAGTWLPILAAVLLLLAVAVPAGRSRVWIALVAAIATAATTLLFILGVGAAGLGAIVSVDNVNDDLISALIQPLIGSLTFRAWVLEAVCVVAAVVLIVVGIVLSARSGRRSREASGQVY